MLEIVLMMTGWHPLGEPGALPLPVYLFRLHPSPFGKARTPNTSRGNSVTTPSDLLDPQP